MRSSTLWFVTVLAISGCHGNGNDAAPQGAAATPTADQAAADRARAAQDEAARALAAADKAAVAAQNTARVAEDQAAKLGHEEEALQKRLDDTIKAVADAKTDAEIAVAKARLEALQKDVADAKAALGAAKQAAEQAVRAKGVHVSKECMDNPLAKGC